MLQEETRIILYYLSICITWKEIEWEVFGAKHTLVQIDTHTTKSPALPNVKANRGKERVYFMVSGEHFYPSKTTLLQLVLSREDCAGIDFLIRNSKTLNRFTFEKRHHLTQWHQRQAKVLKEQERGKMSARV